MPCYSRTPRAWKCSGATSPVGLPPGTFDLNIFDIVLSRKTIRGSIVGTRMDLVESLAFASEDSVKAHYTLDKPENINHIFDEMKAGNIDGRVVMEINPAL